MVAIGAAALLFVVASGGRSFAEDRALKLFNLHTHERAVIVYKRNGVYDRQGLAQLNQFLRDWRRDKVIRMDPHLLDLIWQVYQQSGSTDYIQVVCGYRSPPTNAMLRRRSNGVAQHSQHMLGKAMDFYIPDVPLAKLRAIGLRMQIGGVGFYPTSGSPFVHMDTGSVRHWPRMTRQQLVRVFPNGKTLHVPSDGRPLPGYAEAQAAYRARMAGETPTTKVADFSGSPVLQDVKNGKVLVAAADVSDGEVDDDEVASDAPAPAALAADAPAPDAPALAAPAPAQRAVGTAVASYATAAVPMPRLAPRRPQPVAVAAASDVRDITAPERPPYDIASLINQPLPNDTFGNPQDWSAPAVPAALAAAMAERDQTRRGASLPIAPTAVVATIDVTRPLRAEAITTAVLRHGGDADDNAALPTLLAYAPATLPEGRPAPGVPMPRISPLRASAVASASAPAAPHVSPAARPIMTPQLTMTALDTHSLRMWIGAASTRQKSYAVLTMPDFTSNGGLMDKPDVAFAAGFGRYAYSDLRTDHFSGALVEQPSVVDLRQPAFVASNR